MKHFILYILTLSILTCYGCEETNLNIAADAGLDALKAVTLTDDNVKALALKASQQSDSKHRLASLSNPYGKRLYRLVGQTYQSDGYQFNFRVYLSPTVNAFAMADGTIRIYSGLMDMLNDEELLFVVGHEMGHVVKKHIKKKIRLAYAGRAIRKGIASQENIAGDIARSSLGGFVEALVNAQFSQQEEREADDYGIAYLQKENYRIQSAVSALNKLATLGKNHNFLSSHPAPKERAKRLQDQIDHPDKIGQPSGFEKWMTWLKESLKRLIKAVF